jgi:hypothetical protein
MANIAAQRIKREFKEVIKSEEVGPDLTPWIPNNLDIETFCHPGQEICTKIIMWRLFMVETVNLVKYKRCFGVEFAIMW